MLRMRGIVGILHIYYDMKSFPPASWRDEAGNPTCSWRVVMFGASVSGSQHSIDEPWSSEKNQQLDSDSDRELFAVRSFDSPSKFNAVFALIGPGTAFTEYECKKGMDLIDCPDDAILLVERQNDSAHWMAPGDVELKEVIESASTKGLGDLQPNYPEGHLVAFVDGSVWCISKDVPKDVISKFLTVEGARQHDRDKDLGPYVLEKVPPLPNDDRGHFTFTQLDWTL